MRAAELQVVAQVLVDRRGVRAGDRVGLRVVLRRLGERVEIRSLVPRVQPAGRGLLRLLQHLREHAAVNAQRARVHILELLSTKFYKLIYYQIHLQNKIILFIHLINYYCNSLLLNYKLYLDLILNKIIFIENLYF